MRRFLVLCSLIALASVPKIASATPVSYSVSGSMWSFDEHAWIDGLLSGHVEIDDEVIVNEWPGPILYTFSVLGYGISTEDNLLIGDEGFVQVEHYGNNILGVGDWIFGSIFFGNQTDFQGTQLDFINENGSPYKRNDPESWQTLAPQIILQGELLDWGEGQWPSRTGARLTLNKTSPVPEPSTLILLSTSIVGLAAFRKKFKN